MECLEGHPRYLVLLEKRGGRWSTRSGPEEDAACDFIRNKLLFRFSGNQAENDTGTEIGGKRNRTDGTKTGTKRASRLAKPGAHARGSTHDTRMSPMGAATHWN
jgi:hypothetical protein